MANDNDTPSDFPSAEFPPSDVRGSDFPSVGSLPHLSGGSASAPWTGRRMYASGLSGAGKNADETERSGLGVAETAVWNSFLHRIIKKR